MKTPRRVLRWLSGACWLSAGVWLAAAAQDPAPAPGDGAPPTAPVQIKPRPAEIMPKATQALILGVVDTGEHLIAAGDRGEILASNDGRDWAQVPTPVRSALTAVSFADAQHGWAVGHDAVILHTSDGGRTWTLQNFQPELQEPFLDVLALDANTAYAVGAYGLFEQTTDGGANWTKVDAPAILADQLHLYAIRKLANGDLFIAGEQGTLGLSTDGGKTWSKLKSPYEGTFFGAVPRGAAGALVCGLRGNAYLARDVRKGDWQKIDTGTTNSFFGCAPVDARHAVLVGLNGIIELVDTDTGTARNVRSPGDTPYSDAVAFKGGLVMVGVSGIQHIDNLQ
jgi:photosystem II stability/assembly factor-like uncharacterized protein